MASSKADAAKSAPTPTGRLAGLIPAALRENLGALLLEKRCSFCAAPIMQTGATRTAPNPVNTEDTPVTVDAKGTPYITGTQDTPNAPPAPEPGTQGTAAKPDTTRDCAISDSTLCTSTLCPDCLSALPRRKSGFCQRCGEFTADQKMSGGVCGNCLRLPPPWTGIFFHAAYQHKLRGLLLKLKFTEGLHLAEGLGALLAAHPGLMAQKNAAEPYSRVIPTPLHRSRLRERGFNQSALLAEPLARQLGVHLDLKSLQRTIATGHQTGLTREQRRRNVAGAFACSCSLRGQRILLVDDVMTTGATLAMATTALLQAGAASIDIAVVARTPARNMAGW